MTTLRHPHIPDMTFTPADDEVDAWVAQGWLRDNERPAKRTPSAPSGEGDKKEAMNA